MGNGALRASKVVAGVFTPLRVVPYEPALHRWLRLSESGGTTFWEVSADGVTYTVLYQASDPFTLTAVGLGFGAYQADAAPGFAVFDNFNVQNTSLSRRVEERRLSAREVRVEAADVAAARQHDEHFNNNDEVNYPSTPLTGNFSKGLKHDSLGDPDAASYASLLRALESRDPHDFEEIVLGTIPAETTRVKLTNPQTGLTFDLEAPDPQEITQPPAPRFDSAQTAHEAGELYWMAVARDVPFVDYGSSGIITAAINSLNSEFPQFGGTTPVTAQNVFRGIYPGEQVGPYVSQFLVKGNVDQRKPAGLGHDAADGYISYGSRVINQRLIPATATQDWLMDFSSWLNAQNGVDTRGQDIFDTTPVFIHTLRDGTTLVHFDQVLDAWYNTAWILMSEPMGNELTAAAATGRPQIDAEFPKDQGNPYDPPGTAMDSKTQVGFNTFGPTHLLSTLAEVLVRALRAVWFQKWFNHRRLRPEEYGGRVDNQPGGAPHLPAARQHHHLARQRRAGAVLRRRGRTLPAVVPAPAGVPRGRAHAPGVRGGARHRQRRHGHHPQGVLRRDQGDREPAAGRGRRPVADRLHRRRRVADDAGRRAEQAGGQHRALPQRGGRALALGLHREPSAGRGHRHRAAPGDEPGLQRGRRLLPADEVRRHHHPHLRRQGGAGGVTPATVRKHGGR